MPPRPTDRPLAGLAHRRRPTGLGRAPQIRRREVGRRAVVSFAGELDLVTVPRLERAITSAVERGAAQVWVDLGQTTFMDSTGVHTLLRAQRRLSGLNRGFAVVGPNRPVRRLLALTGADRVITTYADLAEAHRAA